MHLLVITLLIGGGFWLWRHAESPGYRLLAAISFSLGIVSLLALAVFYGALRRDLKK